MRRLARRLDPVHVEVDGGDRDTQALDAGLLGRLAPCGEGQVGLAVRVAARLEPAAQLAVPEQGDPPAAGIDHERRAGEVAGGAGAAAARRDGRRASGGSGAGPVGPTDRWRRPRPPAAGPRRGRRRARAAGRRHRAAGEAGSRARTLPARLRSPGPRPGGSPPVTGAGHVGVAWHEPAPGASTPARCRSGVDTAGSAGGSTPSSPTCTPAGVGEVGTVVDAAQAQRLGQLARTASRGRRRGGCPAGPRTSPPTPVSGSSARSSTAAPSPSAPQTTLAHQWRP